MQQKSHSPRNVIQKRSYIWVFACHSCRPIHLELMMDRIADSFILAIKRKTNKKKLSHGLFSLEMKPFVIVSNILNLPSDLSRFFRTWKPPSYLLSLDALLERYWAIADFSSLTYSFLSFFLAETSFSAFQVLFSSSISWLDHCLLNAVILMTLSKLAILR